MKVVIITKSYMRKEIDGIIYKGSCVTGYDLISKRFVRLVGDINGAPMDYKYSNNLSLLNVYEIKGIKHCPLGPQTENVLSDYGNVVNLGQYSEGINGIHNIYINNFKSNDASFMQDARYKLPPTSQFKHSIEVIKVSCLTLLPAEEKGKVAFDYKGRHYNLFSITDPNFKNQSSENKLIGDAILVVSIPSDPFINNLGENLGYFKFVAAVYPL